MPRGRLAAALTVAGIGLVAFNLRPAITSVGPILNDISAGLGLSGTDAALLTMAPVLCFGLLSPAAPVLARRLGIEWSLGLAAAGITAGLVIRVLGGPAALYAGTVLVSCSIAVANVLLPALIKRDFPRHPGLATGLYFTALGGSAALAAGITVPLERVVGHGWRGALGVWSIPAALALFVWVPELRQRTAPGETPRAGAVAALLRDPRAWQVTAFMALQSFCFYGVVSWIATLYRDHGWTKTQAGVLLAVVTVVGIPLGLVAPTLAARRADQRYWGSAATLLIVVGFTGLLVAPTSAAYVWAVLLGLGLNGAFPLVLTFMVLRSRTTEDTARLSGMAQTVGYVVAAAGPLAVGAIHDATGSWTPSVVLLLAVSVLQVFAAYSAGRAGYVGSPAVDEGAARPAVSRVS